MFSRDACTLLGLSVESPLSVCVNAGCTAVPSLLSIKQVMQQRQVNVWCGMDELPVSPGIIHLCHMTFLLVINAKRFKFVVNDCKDFL